MRHLLYLFVLLSFLISCKKETQLVYEVDNVTVQKDKIGKGVNKSTIEFISIAYSDVFGSSISQDALGKVSLLYTSFGDKRLLEDLLIKNMLNAPSVQLPSNSEMRSDISGFVTRTFQKLYNRDLTELESFELKKRIENASSLTPDMIYYAMMTSDEYRFY
jgi:hypothetical protein